MSLVSALHSAVGGRLSHVSANDILARFTAAVVIVGIVASSCIAWFVDTRVTDLMLTQAAQRAVDQVELGVESRVVAGDFEPPFDQAKLDSLAARLDPTLIRMEESGVIRLNVLAPNGTIIYSDRPSIRGWQIPLDEPFLKALTGTYTRRVSSLSKPQNADLRSRFGGALEVYVPVTIRGRVVGVYEVYEDLAVVQPVHLLVWGTILGTLGPLFLVLLLVAHRASKQMNRELDEHERQVQRDARVESMRRLDRIANELLSSVSHELREPLSLVHGYAELLASRTRAFDAEQIRQIASEINRGSSLMTRIVDDLMDFNRVERGSFRLDSRETDLVAVIHDTLEIFAQKRGAERLMVEAPHPVIVVGDPQRLGQVAANLISNALRYAPTGPIRIRVDRAPDGRAVLEVKDSGPGISAEALPRLWEMFYRAPEVVDSPISGTGIGLALVKHLVEAHGGTVEVESKLNEGATFRVYLPAQPSQAPRPRLNAGGFAPNAGLARSGERITTPSQGAGTPNVLEEVSSHLASLP